MVECRIFGDQFVVGSRADAEELWALGYYGSRQKDSIVHYTNISIMIKCIGETVSM